MSVFFSCFCAVCRHNIPDLDGIVLTHDHADAMLGLDDVRGIQVREIRKRRAFSGHHLAAGPRYRSFVCASCSGVYGCNFFFCVLSFREANYVFLKIVKTT